MSVQNTFFSFLSRIWDKDLQIDKAKAGSVIMIMLVLPIFYWEELFFQQQAYSTNLSVQLNLIKWQYTSDDEELLYIKFLQIRWVKCYVVLNLAHFQSPLSRLQYQNTLKRHLGEKYFTHFLDYLYKKTNHDSMVELLILLIESEPEKNRSGMALLDGY